MGLLAACGGADATPRVVVQDSAGVQIVVSAGPAWGTESGAWTLEATPAFELSSDPNVPEQTLVSISDVDLLSDGRIVIANSRSYQLLVFDSTGAFLDAWGGRGEGPGEFSLVGAVMPCARDTLVERLATAPEGGRGIEAAADADSVTGPEAVSTPQRSPNATRAEIVS